MKESTRLTVINLITWLFRLAVGGVFVYSGFVKAIDPWGTIYKFHDYLAAMNFGLADGLVLIAVVLLCVYEFLTGAFLLTGSFRRAAPWMSGVLMLFMTPLTLWIALKDPVADCGCFGDAFIISNWATFWKNIALCIMTGWLIVFNRRIHWLITPSLQWLGFVVDATFVSIVSFFGYSYQPLIDSRPYKVGEKLVEISDTAYEPEYEFVYEKDGQRRSFGIDDEQPDESDGWTFVERKELPSKNKGGDRLNSEKSLVILDENDDDVTADVIQESGAQLILFMPDMNHATPASSYQINSLFSSATQSGIDFIAVVAGSKEQIEQWRDLSMARYPIYTTEDTTIKEIVRGNPGVVYLEDGTIKWKSTLKALPYDDFMQKGASHDPMSYAVDTVSILRNIIYLYLTVMAVLILFSFAPGLKRMYEPWQRRRHPSAEGGNKD